MILKINKNGEKIAEIEVIETETGNYIGRAEGAQIYDEGMQQGEYGFSQCFEIDLKNNITKDIVLKLEKETGCPILEMFKTDDEWYVCFEQYIVIEGEGQTVALDELMQEVKKYDNIENFTNKVYTDDEKENTYFEQVTFEWKE